MAGSSAREFDVAVVGLGGMGSAVAAELARRKVRVLGVERHQPAHGFGSSHGRTRRIAQVYPEHPAYVPLLLRAYERWRELEAAASVALLYETGGLMIGPEASHVVSRGLASARRFGLEHELLGPGEVTRRWPTFTPGAHDVALYEPHAGYVLPEATVRAQVRLAQARGATLRFGEEVRGWDLGAAGVELETTARSYRAERLVVAAGAWAERMLRPFGVPLRVERLVQFWLQPSVPIERFAPARHPVYVWEAPDGVQVYGFPATGGAHEGVKVAFSHHGTHADPDDLRRTVDPSEVEPLLDFLADRRPGLGPGVVSALPCMYTITPDQDFVLGFAPGEPRVFICSPCSGHGFKFVPVVGEVVADLLETGRSRFDLTIFDPGRFAAPASRRVPPSLRPGGAAGRRCPAPPPPGG